MSTEPIVVEQVYGVDRATVWRAITDPEQMRQWYFEPMQDFRPEVGFETEFDVECEGRIFPHQWKVTVVEPESSIAYQWRYGGYDGDTTVQWELSDTAEGVKLTLTHSGCETFPQDDPLFTREAGIGGWTYFLQQSLKGFLDQQDGQTSAS